MRGLVAGLLLLQFFALVVALGAADHLSGFGGASVLSQTQCGDDAGDAPVERHSAAGCCALCSPGARALLDGAYFGVAAFVAVPPSPRVGRLQAGAPAAIAPKHYGWASSWSSCAPPSGPAAS